MASRKPSGNPSSNLNKSPSSDFKELREQFERRTQQMPTSASSGNLTGGRRRRSLSDGSATEKLITDNLILSPVLERDTPSVAEDAHSLPPGTASSGTGTAASLPAFLQPSVPPVDPASKSSKELVENLIDYVFSLDKKNLKEEKAKLDQVEEKQPEPETTTNPNATSNGSTKRKVTKRKSVSSSDLSSLVSAPIQAGGSEGTVTPTEAPTVKKDTAGQKKSVGPKDKPPDKSSTKGKKRAPSTSKGSNDGGGMSLMSAMAGNVMTLAEQMSKIPVMVAGVAPPESTGKPGGQQSPEGEPENKSPTTKEAPADSQQQQQTSRRRNSKSEATRSSSIGPKVSTGSVAGGNGGAAAAGGAGGGRGRKGAPSPTMSPQHVSQHVANTGPRRILVLAAKGDWPAVDLILRSLEKNQLQAAQNVAASPDPNLRPLADLADEQTGQTPLMYAAHDNKLSILERMVELGADVNAKNVDGLSVLHVAAAFGKEEILRFLVLRKADVLAQGGPKSYTPLHQCCARPPSTTSVGLIRILLLAGPKDFRFFQDKNEDIPLFVAADSGNVTLARELLSQSPELQLSMRRKSNKDTVLHMAVRRRDLELCRLFVEHKVKIDVQNAEGQTPLHIAACEGDEAIVKFFYTLHANASLADKEDRTPLHLAAEKGHPQVVELLAERFKASVFDRTKDGSTLIHVASRNGHQETALAFLRKGVHLHMPNKKGWRSLHVAAERGHVNVVNALLQKGEQVDAVTNDRMTPLHVAVLSGKPAVVETLLGHGAQVELKGGKSVEAPLHLAAQIPDGDKCAEMLIKCGANVRARTEDQRTPLHIAAKSGNIPCLKLLLAEGSDPTDKSQNGDTPLHHACMECHMPVVQLLLEHVKARQGEEALSQYVNAQNVNGETAAHFAAEIPKFKVHSPLEDQLIMRRLQEAGANIARLCTRMTKETPLHYCARSGNPGVLREMLSLMKANDLQTAVNKQSSAGWSPLLAAANGGHLQVVQILLENHARVDVFDLEGRAALHLAAEKGHREITDLLLSHKAFVNSKVMSGQTALHMAATNGFNDLVKVLVVKHNAMIEALTLTKQTPLHAAAAAGQLNVCKTLIELGANVNAVDGERQTALHLAAENNHSDVVKFFLNLQPELVTTANKMGNTCAHIAAEKGSAEVVKELLKFNKSAVTSARNKTSDATPLHLAAKGGHVELVKILLENGASVTDENRTGETPLHLAARYGHLGVVEALQGVASPRAPSRKTGLSPIHVAAFFGEADVVQELLAHVPATVTSASPALVSTSLLKELGSESGLTPLHLAAYSGRENVVRILLNSPGVQHDVTTNLHGYTPLHLACLNGHLAVVGLLLSRSTEQLDQGDKRGRTGLHLASSGGHAEMVALLLGQGADINAIDRNGWTPLHYAAKAGHLEVVKLLVESGASPKSESREGKIPLCLAAASERNDVVSHLLHREHNTYALLDDKKFILDLMWCSRKDNLKQLSEFVLVSAAPVDTAAKLSYILRYLSLREKDRSKDLLDAAKFAENMAKELLSLAAGTSSAGILLRSMDHRSVPLLDILIEYEQKEVVAHTAVQKYLGEVWKGPIAWSQWQTLLVFLAFLFCAPIWIIFSLPLGHKYSRIPLIKFLSYLTSHLYFVALLILTIVTPLRPIWLSTSMIPSWYEWILLAWISGLLLSELTNPGDRAGLGWLRVMILMVCGIGIGIHLVGFALDHPERADILYIRNQFLALALLMCCVQLLDFLTFHYLFGPWAIIISNLMVDLGRFLVILFIFIFGFSMHVAAIYQPVIPIYAKANSTLGDGYPPVDAPVQTPIDTFELLFYALFGLVEPDYLPPMHAHPRWAMGIMKVVFGVYMMVTVVVLINLLIAMMSDTYQRIQSKSDAEWKFGLAKLIRNMNRTSGTPSPLNLVTKLIVYLHAVCKYRGDICKRDAQEYIRTEHVPDDPYALDVAAFATGGWMKRFKDSRGYTKSNKIGPKDATPIGRVNSAGGASIMEGPRRLETVVDWSRVIEKYLALIGQTTTPQKDHHEHGVGTVEHEGHVNGDANYPGYRLPNSDVLVIPPVTNGVISETRESNA